MKFQTMLMITSILFSTLRPVLAAELLGPGFTYQGRYEVGEVPLDGTVDLYFSLWDAPTGGNRIGEVQQRPGVAIVDGTFNTIVNSEEEFGPDAFIGESRWLEIWVCDTPGCTTPEVLTPRQPIMSTPYSAWARSAPWSGLGGVPEGFADGVDDAGDSVWGNSGGDVFYSSGKVGIGSDAPNHQLRISGGPAWTNNLWQGALELENGAAIGWRSNGPGNRYGIGHTDGGLWFFRTAGDPGTATSDPVYDMIINDLGRIGIGTINPTSKLEIAAQDGLAITGFQPFLTLRDTSANNSRGIIQSADGNLLFYTNGAIGGAPSMGLFNGPANIGVGTITPIATTKLNVVTNAAGYQAVRGDAPNGNGVVGTSGASTYGAVAGVHTGTDGIGVYGEANQGTTAWGVFGSSSQGVGVRGLGPRGVIGRGGSVGVQAIGSVGGEAGLIAQDGGGPRAAYFEGNVVIEGDLSVSGMYSKVREETQIDHPLDPENKYLSHSTVESPDMMNIYNGNIVLDEEGKAEVTLPDWFMAFNKDFRYQLTPIGGPGANLYIAQEIADGKFRIAGGTPNLEVSWQVTGIRNDPYAKANPVEVVKEKTPKEKGKYLNPELYGQPKEKRIYSRPDFERIVPAVVMDQKLEESK
ncbi:MAG: hypothetical protein H6751_04460 [Candidatus Omnitrophica bacterium]|nr:hypothetical protein [Candidatus Omnitrophota bacterium]MCB9782199.1 hypothetical protein [Candidatus Omnitrophota bacterium]